MKNTNDPLAAKYDPSAIERKLYEEWEREGYFAPKSGTGKPYSIVIPPPNVTGTLHVGHAFQHTIMDVLIRYHRMMGRETLWQTGTDHAGISTQMVVTEQLAAEGTSPHKIGREAFVDRVWKWKEQAGSNITQQMRRLGSSVDWKRERFTMDEEYALAVTEVFVRLYQQGLIYRGSRLVNWDPHLQTALSDLEVVSEEEDGELWHIRYPLAPGFTTEEGNNHLVIATTRPETMLGDTAVAVHPEDKRYKCLIGSDAILPLVGRRLPIIGDDYVDRDFGTGCLKVTPAHDFNDYEIGQRHNLSAISILTKQARINENAPPAYQGLDRFAARARIVRDLETEELLVKVEPHKLQIPRGERSKKTVEPMITEQWFVDVQPLAKDAIEAVESGKIRFEPKRWENVYFSWMRNIRDWCISRQLWWGHRIPAWYDTEGNVYVGRDENEVRVKHALSEEVKLTQDPDVLETWFSSAIWTFATMGWPETTEDLRKFHPTNVLVTGHDIIFFWIARMIMMTQRFAGEIPFHVAYVTGLVRDARGRKMSKTAGNGLDPLDIIDGVDLETLVAKRTGNLPQPRMATKIERNTRTEYPNGIPAFGADALRFNMCAIASPGSNYNFDLKRVEGYHFFCNKLWNATRFVLANCAPRELQGTETLTVADRWIRSRMQALVAATHKAIESYRFDLYAEAVYQFAWHEYCDWYLEITKTLFFDTAADSAEVRGARSTLLAVLEALLRITHPIMPFVTETLWKEVFSSTGRHARSLMLENYPSADEFEFDEASVSAISWLIDTVTLVRNIRGIRQIPPKREIQLLFADGNDTDRSNCEISDAVLRRLIKSEEIRWLNQNEPVPPASVQTRGELRILVPFDSKREFEHEWERIGRELSKANEQLKRVNAKLANEQFLHNAPARVIEAERTKATELEISKRVFEEQRKALSGSHLQFDSI